MILPSPRSTLFPYTTLFRSFMTGDKFNEAAGIMAKALSEKPDHVVLMLSGGNDSISASHLDRKSTRLNSSHMSISYAVFCLKKKNHSKFLITASNQTTAPFS